MAKAKRNIQFELATLDSSLEKLQTEIRAGNSCSVFGVQNSMRAAIVSALERKILYIVSSDIFANAAVSNFEIMGLNVKKLPFIQDEFLYKRAQSNEIYLERLKTLYDIIAGRVDIVVCEISALFSFLPSPKQFIGHSLKLKTGQYVDIMAIERKLIDIWKETEKERKDI